MPRAVGVRGESSGNRSSSPGGYQVGAFPPGCAEWNDKFRDMVRDFWRSAAPASAIAPRLCASGDLFNHHEGRRSVLIRFVQSLTALGHKYPLLRRSRFLTGVYIEELGTIVVTLSRHRA